LNAELDWGLKPEGTTWNGDEGDKGLVVGGKGGKGIGGKKDLLPRYPKIEVKTGREQRSGRDKLLFAL